MAIVSQWDSDSAFLAMYVATGLIAGQEPQSLMLIGESDEGKSSLLARFSETPRVLSLTNAYGNDLKIEVHKRKPRHLLVDELVALLAHTDAAVDNILTFLRQVLSGNGGEEIIGQGSSRMAMDFSGYRCGILTSITRSQFSQAERILRAGGFDTRLNMFRLRRSDAERARVRSNVLADNATDLKPWRWSEWQLGRPAISVHKDVRRVFDAYVTRYFAESGNRAVKQLMILLSSVAFLRGHSVADIGDMAWLVCFHEYWTHLGNTTKPVLAARVWQARDHFDPDVLDFALQHALPVIGGASRNGNHG